MTGIGNDTQIRVIAEPIAEAAIIKIAWQFTTVHPSRSTTSTKENNHA